MTFSASLIIKIQIVKKAEGVRYMLQKKQRVWVKDLKRATSRLAVGTKALNYYLNMCEVGATERGCSGSIGSDDTRGYGAGSGDVGKELPRGMIP